MDKSLYLDHLNLLPIPGEAFFYPGFFEKEVSDQYFNYLNTQIAWKQEPVKVFGKQVMLPRFTAFYGDEGIKYTYLGVSMQASAWTAELQQLKEVIESKFDVKFNSCMLNNYRNGADYVGWHRDNSRSLGQYPFIASVSFGASRIFQFRHFVDKMPIISIELNHGSLLVMKAETQHLWEHRLPKTVVPTSTRINLTFLLIK